MSERMRVPYLLSVALAALMFAQSLLGLLLQGQYRDADWIKAAWWGNDWVTLIVAVPLLLAGMVLASRGSMRGLLLWLGMLGYAVYNYAYYLFGVALTTFFPFYGAALVLAVATLILSLSRIDAAAVAASFWARTPVRLIKGADRVPGVALALLTASHRHDILQGTAVLMEHEGRPCNGFRSCRPSYTFRPSGPNGSRARACSSG